MEVPRNAVFLSMSQLPSGHPTSSKSDSNGMILGSQEVLMIHADGDIARERKAHDEDDADK